jgi:methionyl-tRNA formyltransferase
MKIVVFTSSDHIYANLILSGLIKQNTFNGHTVTVLEQDSIIPRKSIWAGLFKYIKVSGLLYVGNQIAKQMVFKFRRMTTHIFGKSDSIYYPYNQIKRTNINIRTMNIIRSPENQEFLARIKPDLIISIYSKEIIPEKIIQLPKYGCINLHPAPLPKYKGVSPIFWALANKESTFGSTLHYINTGIDTGKIIFRKVFKYPVPASEHAVYLKCASIGMKQISDFLNLPSFTSLKTIPNPNNGSYYSLPTREAVHRFLASGNTFFSLGEFL